MGLEGIVSKRLDAPYRSALSERAFQDVAEIEKPAQ
jgi:ATP-dependent DNA ligase